MTVLLHSHAIAVGLLLNKPTYLFSQSVGPFGNRFQGYLTAKVLNRVDLIFAREDFTVETLKKIGVRDAIVRKAVDAAFLFQTDTKQVMKDFLAAKGLDFSKPLVGITVKRFLSKPQQDFYEHEMAQFIDWLSKQNMQPVIIPQVTSKLHNDDDRDVGVRIGQLLNSRQGCLIIEDDLNHFQAKGIYENMDWFVGTRMHSCIFSLTAYVPIIAIEYEYKTGGIMKALGLYDWVIKMADVTFDRLSAKFTALNKGREEYLKILRSNLPPYLDEARSTAETIKASYLSIKK
jgi:colanic acid/amylovoran biosynthesis protein